MPRPRVGVLSCVLVAAVLSPALASAQTRIGPEFVVNTQTQLWQYDPSIGRDGSGFVITWQSFYQDLSGPGIFGQRFSHTGVKLGAEFQVNTYTTSYQIRPRIAKFVSSLEFVVVWGSTGDRYNIPPYWYARYDGQDGSASGLFGRRFDVSGNPLGSEFMVNTYTTGEQQDQAVATDPAGNFVVVWESVGKYVHDSGYVTPHQDGSFSGVFGQRFDASGGPVGGEFQVNSYTTYWQSHPAIAKDPSGNFVVVWDGYGDSSIGIFGQRFDASGTRLGDEFRVNTYTGPQPFERPAVAMDDYGNFVVAWRSVQDGHYSGIFGQRFFANGTPRGSEFQVNTYTTSWQSSARVASDQAGNFVVIWTSYLQDGDRGGLFGQAFANNGSRLGPEFQVNTYTTNYQYFPDVIMKYNGEFVVSWTYFGADGSGGGVVAERFDLAAEQDGKALDFHADGKSDLVWYNKSTGEVALWKMNGGTYTAANTITTVADLNWNIVAGGDLNGDGKGDLIWVNSVTGQVYLWQMNGHTPTATTPITTLSDLNWKIQATGDTNGDGKADIIWQHQKSGAVYVWRMNGTAVVSTTPVATVPDLAWRIVGARDVSGDGKADLLWRNNETGQVYVWIMNGSTVSSVALITAIGFDWRIMAGGDFGGDGKSDLVWYNQTTGQCYIWTMNGGTITAVLPVATVDPNTYRLVASGDFNGNGKADLLWYNKLTGATYVWLMNNNVVQSISTVATVGDGNWGLAALH